MEEVVSLPENTDISRDMVTGGMGLILAGLTEAIRAKAAEINAQDDQDISQAVIDLEEKVLIIGYGLRKKPKQKKLHDFDERIKRTYNASVDAIEIFANDRYRLVDMALKIGMAIHSDATAGGLLTEKAQRQLDELND